MPADLLPFATGTVGVVALWMFGLVRLGVLTPPDVRAWRRLAQLRGFESGQTRLERVAGRVSAIRHVRDELDIDWMLACAQRGETAAGFIARTGVLALVATACVLAVVSALRALGDGNSLPLPLVVLAPIVVVLSRLVLLRSAAARSREVAGRTLGDMMMLVAVLTDGRGLQLEDAVRILARCATTPDLSGLVDGGWRRLLGDRRMSTIDTYRLVAERYRIPAFATVTDALATTNIGIAERDTYTRVAQSVYAQRLADARQRAARVRILVTLPVAGMLIPLLLLLGAPAFAAISAGLGRG